MFGAESGDELVGLKSTDLFHPDDRARIAARRKSSKHSDTALPLIEVVHMRLDGTTFEGESTSAKIVWEGSPAILVEIRDITDRKNAERIAQENQDQYRHFMELMPDAVFVHCNSEVVFVNPATVKMFGAESADELLGKPSRQLLHPDDWENVRSHQLNVEMGRPITEVLEIQYVRLNGVQFQGEGRSSRITWNKQPAHLVAVRDVTERREIEARWKMPRQPRKHRIAPNLNSSPI